MRGAHRYDLSEWQCEPGHSFALIVGIDEYDEDVPATPGLAAQAAGVATRLCAAGVPADNVHLLLAGDDNGQAPAGVRRSQFTGAKQLHAALHHLADVGGQFLWGHWAGHGLLAGVRHRLLLPDAQSFHLSNIARDDLLGSLRGSCRRQYWTIDSCQTDWPNPTGPTPIRDIDADFEPGALTVVLTSSRQGEPAAHRRTQAGGTLGSAVVEFLDAELAGPPRWPPPPDLFEHDLPDRLSAAVGDTYRLFRFEVETPYARYSRNDFGPPVEEPPVPRRELVGWALPPDWRPGELDACTSDGLCRLDLRWVVDRGAHSAVVAEPRESDLVADLDAAEEDLTAALGEHLDLPRRRWSGIDAAPGRAPVGLPPAPNQNDGRRPEPRGFVCRVDVGLASLDAVGRVRDAVDDVVRRVDAVHPDASLIVAVRGRTAADALLTAARLTGPVPLGRRRDGDHTRWRAYTRIRPGTAAETADTERTVDLPDGPTGLLPMLSSWLRAEAERRDTPLEWAPESSAEQVPGDPQPVPAVAQRVVAELEAGPSGRDTGAAQCDGKLDEHLLCAVRDLLSDLYHPLLRAFAANRHGPGWGAALGVAAAFDEDIEVWLAAADRGPGHPDSWPAARYRTRPGDAVVLHLLRGGSVDLAVDWQQIGTSPDADEVLALYRTHPDGPPPLNDLSAIVLRTLARAGLYRPSLRAGRLDSTQDQIWVVIANSARERVPFGEELAVLVGPTADDQMACQVLGLLPVDDQTDPMVRQRVAELRHVLIGVFEESTR